MPGPHVSVTGGIENTIHNTVRIGNYLKNLGNPDHNKWGKSYECFLDGIQRWEQLGLELYNCQHKAITGYHVFRLPYIAYHRVSISWCISYEPSPCLAVFHV
ncbi:hypothetical protein F5141DRAFT_1060768 [Pisolithus sp. B1]|nr:hypothetical protein F5141DRAFT_1060768 [Pisolithus sp. B1]